MVSIKTPPEKIGIDDNTVLLPIFKVDAAIIYNCIENTRSNLVPFLSHWDRSFEETKAFLDSQQSQWGISGEHAYAIIERGDFVGVLSLLRLDAKNRAAELGYWLAVSAQGRGIMTRVAQTALELLFRYFDANQVIITSFAENLKSRAVAERLGFRLDGITRQWRFNRDGELCDKAVYSLLRSEWESQLAISEHHDG